MSNLLEYSDNYADSSGTLWQFKRDEQNMNNGNPADVTTNGSLSFKYKSSLLGDLDAVDVSAVNDNAAYRLLYNAKIAVPLKHLSNFFRSLGMPLINCKIHLELN